MYASLHHAKKKRARFFRHFATQHLTIIFFPTPFRPPHTTLDRSVDFLFRRLVRSRIIQYHHHIHTQIKLNLYRFFGSKQVFRSVNRTLKLRAVFRHPSFVGVFVNQRIHLISAGVGKNQSLPSHKRMHSARSGDTIAPGRKHQMIGIDHQSFGPRGAQLFGRNSSHRRTRRIRHKKRSFGQRLLHKKKITLFFRQTYPAKIRSPPSPTAPPIKVPKNPPFSHPPTVPE